MGTFGNSVLCGTIDLFFFGGGQPLTRAWRQESTSRLETDVNDHATALSTGTITPNEQRTRRREFRKTRFLFLQSGLR